MKDVQLISDILRVEYYKAGDIAYPAPMQIRLDHIAASLLEGKTPVAAWDIREEDDTVPTMDSTPSLKITSSRQDYGTVFEAQMDCTMNDLLKSVRAQYDTLNNGDDYDLVVTTVNPDVTSKAVTRRLVFRCAPNTFLPSAEDNIASKYGTFAVKVKMKSCTPLIEVTE